MEVIWGEKAKESYNKAIEYSLENYGQSATIDLIQRVEEAVAKIVKYPSASPLVSSIDVEDIILRRVSIKGPLQLVYQEKEDVCNILMVWNSNMSPKRLLKIVKP